MKYSFLIMLGLLIFCSFASYAFADMPPPGPPPKTKPLEYLFIIVAEVIGLLVGMVILTHKHQTRWQKAALTMAIALTVSYVIGISVWTSGYLAGIPVYNPLVIASRNPPHSEGFFILLLPEFMGTFIGGIIIHGRERLGWKASFGIMGVAMLTSLLIGSLIINLFFGPF